MDEDTITRYMGGEDCMPGLESIRSLMDRFSPMESICFIDQNGLITNLENVVSLDLLDAETVFALFIDDVARQNEIDITNFSYEEFVVHTGKRLFTERQMQYGAHIFCGRSPSNRNCLGFGYNCNFYSYGNRGYGFHECAGFCGSGNCARTIQRSALQTIRKFAKHCKRWFTKKYLLDYRDAIKLQASPVSAIKLIFIAKFIGTNEPRYLGQISDFL